MKSSENTKTEALQAIYDEISGWGTGDLEWSELGLLQFVCNVADEALAASETTDLERVVGMLKGKIAWCDHILADEEACKHDGLGIAATVARLTYLEDLNYIVEKFGVGGEDEEAIRQIERD